jgi:deoxyadenosine/deoxycytidine kinase
MLSKALEMGVCFHRVPLLENMEELSFLRAFERREKNSYLDEFYEDFERYEKCPVNGYLTP